MINSDCDRPVITMHDDEGQILIKILPGISEGDAVLLHRSGRIFERSPPSANLPVMLDLMLRQSSSWSAFYSARELVVVLDCLEAFSLAIGAVARLTEDPKLKVATFTDASIDPVGLEYSIGFVTWAFGVAAGAAHSGGDLVFVGDPAKDSLSADAMFGEVDRLRRSCLGLSRGELGEGPVRPAGVVVPEVLDQNPV